MWYDEKMKSKSKGIESRNVKIIKLVDLIIIRIRTKIIRKWNKWKEKFLKLENDVRNPFRIKFTDYAIKKLTRK